MKRFFIIGTDTNCGKTYVTGQLLTYLKEKKRSAWAIKPVATGCWEQDGQLVNEDILHLQAHNGEVNQDSCPWRFIPPVSPNIAAAEVGTFIAAKAVATYCDKSGSADLDYLLIEGVGGLMAPLNAHETWLDVLIHSPIPVILVVGLRIGCINHALLTALALQARQVHCVGWIANCIDRDMRAVPENIETLSQALPYPLWATVPFGGKIVVDAAVANGL